MNDRERNLNCPTSIDKLHVRITTVPLEAFSDQYQLDNNVFVLDNCFFLFHLWKRNLRISCYQNNVEISKPTEMFLVWDKTNSKMRWPTYIPDKTKVPVF